MALRITATMTTKKQPLRDATVSADDTYATASQVADWLDRNLPDALRGTDIHVSVQETKKDGTPKGDAVTATPYSSTYSQA